VTRASNGRRVAIFDLGGVLIEWNPRYLYRKLFAGDEAAMEDFLANVCTTEWNERQDAGRTFAEATQALLPRHADKRELIEAWGTRFGEMIPGAIDGGVEVLAALKASGTPVYGISNWSAETFPPQRDRFPLAAGQAVERVDQREAQHGCLARIGGVGRGRDRAPARRSTGATRTQPKRPGRTRSGWQSIATSSHSWANGSTSSCLWP